MRLILEAVSFALAAINIGQKSSPQKTNKQTTNKPKVCPETLLLLEVLLFGKCDDNIGVGLHLLG